MTDTQILDMYRKLGEFLSLSFSEYVEVVVHDVSKLDSSIIAIYNNQASGRGLHGPMTDYGLLMIKCKVYENQDFITNYRGISGDNKQLRSSTFFIKNGEDKLIGTLCINVDITEYDSVCKRLQRLVNFGEAPEAVSAEPPPTLQVQESFHASAGEMMELAANDYLKENHLTLRTLNAAEKQALIAHLRSRGLFMFKGGIAEAARILSISEPTIYRYLRKIGTTRFHAQPAGRYAAED